MPAHPADVTCYFTHVSIPISALQRNAAEVVRRVAASGRVEEVTDRGRVVAVIGPPPVEKGIAALRAQGASRPPTTDRVALQAALREAAKLPHAGLAAALREQRDDDR